MESLPLSKLENTEPTPTHIIKRVKAYFVENTLENPVFTNVNIFGICQASDVWEIVNKKNPARDIDT